MSAYVVTQLVCDASGCLEDFIGTVDVNDSGARFAAARYGWEQAWSGDQHIDLCPQHCPGSEGPEPMTTTPAPLTVPADALDQAYDIALDSRSRGLDLGQMSARIMHEAAPRVVAAELRRLARIANDCAPDPGSFAGWGDAMDGMAGLLRARADELDPR
jgi:hypothetical protein